MSKPPEWFAAAMIEATRKDNAILFAKGLEPNDRELLLWALEKTKGLELPPEERKRCRDLLETREALADRGSR